MCGCLQNCHKNRSMLKSVCRTNVIQCHNVQAECSCHPAFMLHCCMGIFSCTCPLKVLRIISVVISHRKLVLIIIQEESHGRNLSLIGSTSMIDKQGNDYLLRKQKTSTVTLLQHLHTTKSQHELSIKDFFITSTV